MKISILFLTVAVVTLGLTTANDIDEEIYNGYNAVKGQFPYQVLQIQRSARGSSACGGSLINKNWVLTAAHCAYQVISTTVYFGLVNTADMSTAVKSDVPTANHYVHPQYNPATIQNDIALLKLNTAITTNQYISIINLPKLAQAPPSTFDNKMATASGWGKTQDNENGIHSILQFRTINIMSHSTCVSTYRNVNTVTNGMICTDKRVVYAGPCQGDSGGPLTINGTDTKPFLVGAVSWGVGNCSNTNPVVYVNVANYLRWINSVSGIPIS